MEYTIRESKEIVWCSQDDRYVLIIKKDGEVIGLNYMQGDELEEFKSEYDDIDEELTDFYNATCVYLGGSSELDRINQAIWAYFEFKVAKYERKAL
jgi:hypothetical protein